MALASAMSKTCSLALTPHARAAIAVCDRDSSFAIGECQMAASASQSESDGAANATCRAGDHRNRVLQTERWQTGHSALT